MLLAKGFQPACFLFQNLLINSLGHEEDPTSIDLGDLVQVALNLIEIVLSIDDEFDLIRVTLNKLFDNRRTMPTPLMCHGPPGMFPRRRRGITELRADGQQVAHCRKVPRAGCLNGDVVPLTIETSCQFHEVGKKLGSDVVGRVLRDEIEDPGLEDIDAGVHKVALRVLRLRLLLKQW